MITRNEGIMPPPKTRVKVISDNITFRPTRFFFDKGYAIVSVKNIAVAAPAIVTKTDTTKALGRVSDVKIYLYASR